MISWNGPKLVRKQKWIFWIFENKWFFFRYPTLDTFILEIFLMIRSFNVWYCLNCQVVFWIVTFFLNTIIFIWLGKEGINFTQLLSILSQILPIAKVIFYTFEHINHILGVKINIYQFICKYFYYKMYQNVVFPILLILSINQGDKTEKNIKTSPSLPSQPSLPITIVRSREYDLLNTSCSNLPWQT